MTSFGIFLSQESQSQCNGKLYQHKFVFDNEIFDKVCNIIENSQQYEYIQQTYIFKHLYILPFIIAFLHGYMIDYVQKCTIIVKKKDFFWCVNLNHQRLFVAVSVNVRSCMKVCKVWGEMGGGGGEMLV